MAFVPERVDPVFGDALAGDGGMTDPVSTGPRQDRFDTFPDALSAMPLPAATFIMSPESGAPTAAPAPPAVVRPRPAQAGPVPARARPVQSAPAPPPPIAVAPPYGRPPVLPRATRPIPPATSAGGVVAPSSGRRPVAGLGYVVPTATSAGVVRPPAYLPQNQGLASLRAAVRPGRATAARPPASPPSAIRPAPPIARRSNRASSLWALFVFVGIFLVSSGSGRQIVEAISRLLHHQ